MGRASLGSTNEYISPFGTTSAPGTSAGQVSMLSPATSVIPRNLSVRISNPPGTGAQRQIILTSPGGTSLFGCVIAEQQNSCQVPGAAFSALPPNSELVIFSVTIGSPPATELKFGYTLGP
jgi:hypothetical protein